MDYIINMVCLLCLSGFFFPQFFGNDRTQFENLYGPDPLQFDLFVWLRPDGQFERLAAHVRVVYGCCLFSDFIMGGVEPRAREKERENIENRIIISFNNIY